MEGVTSKISEYVQSKGVSIAAISEQTGFPYGAIYPSLCQNPTRRMRADELLAVCRFLEVDPMRFYVPRENEAS